ncbi:MAG: DMT family transporter [Alphaproteobacteria bacterium]
MKRPETKAALYMLGAAICFALLDGTAKILVDPSSPLGSEVSAMQVVWIRFMSHAMLLAIFLTATSTWHYAKSQHPFLQLFRSLLMAITTFLNFTAVAYLQLDQTMAIFFATPFIVALLAGPILGEWIGWYRFYAISVGFVGVLIVTSPWQTEMHWAIFLAIGAAVCLSFFNISTRWLAAKEGVNTTFLYTVCSGIIVFAPFAWHAWDWSHSIVTWCLLAITGLFGGVGHYFFTVAHGLAPAPKIAPYMYAQILFMILFGYIFFTDIPEINTIVGATIIIASGIYLFHRELVRARESQTERVL